MRTIIHDLEEKDLKKIKFQKDDILLSSLECNKHCIGCFSCWIKHPKRCALRDDFSIITDYLKETDELIIISKCRYGCYSSGTKRILERCIGYVLPYFTIRKNEIHHASRYSHQLNFKVYFYDIQDEEDKENAKKLVKANAINLDAKTYEVEYLKEKKELAKCIH